MNTKITIELLLNNNWKQSYGIQMNGYYNIHICDNKFHLEINPYSNMIGRNWNVHVDNEDFESIGSCNIETIEQFNDFMKVLDIEYKLENI